MPRPVPPAPASRTVPAGLPESDRKFFEASIRGSVAISAGDAAGAMEPLAEMHRLQPGHPQLPQYVRVAAIVGFIYPGERSSYEPPPCEAPPSESVDLVAFHVDAPWTPHGGERVDYLGVLRQSFDAARLRAPRARRILLTDEATRVPDTVGADEILRVPLDPSRLMYERMRAQAAYLERREAGRASVLMDVDVVVNRDPADCFTESFDVGLTYRMDAKDAPFNGGIILAAPGVAALAFTRRTLACYDALAANELIGKLHARVYPEDMRAWWGDQYAWFASVGQRAFCTRAHEGLVVEGTRLAFYPCDDYNYTVASAEEAASPALDAKRFLHFKGSRKPWIADYLTAVKARS